MSHDALSRRHLLKLAIGCGAVALTPSWALAQGARAPAAAGARWDRTLVLLELSGGNDGLNTIVPFADPAYRAARPGLALGGDQVLPLTQALGLNRAMEPLMPLWQGGEVAFLLGVGYPRPNRSHFRSIEIWDTASESNQYLDQGWVAQVLAAAPPPSGAAADAVSLGRESGPMDGGGLRVVALPNPGGRGDRTLRFVDRMEEQEGRAANPAMAHILKVRRDLRAGARALAAASERAGELGVEFPQNGIGRQLEAAARIIRGGAGVPVIKVAHGGFDTHQNQPGTHTRLLTELGAAMAAFRHAMVKASLWDRVLVMTYGEFGRRVRQNGSNGTDHGTAAPHFVMGGKVRGGLYGSQPSLTDLDGGDLKFNLDFRALYATAARDWMGIPGAFGQRRSVPLLKG